MNDTSAAPLAPWLQTQLGSLLAQRGHAWLLAGPSGLGQFELALALASAWLCDNPTAKGACRACGSCHAVSVHTHADLALLLPEVVSLELGLPLDEKTQRELDEKKRKPSKEIKVDAARAVVTFTQLTRSRGSTKVVLVYPAERMNGITANTLLKTLEEPPGEVKFILASEAAHQLLPTIRSRCQSHAMAWPAFGAALTWLEQASAAEAASDKKPIKPLQLADLRCLLTAAGGRPADALGFIKSGQAHAIAQRWQALPKAMANGDVGALADMSAAQAVDALQKLCHDVWVVSVGGQPRFFEAADIPPAKPSSEPFVVGKSGAALTADSAAHLAVVQAASLGVHRLAVWAKELATLAKTVEHPYNPGLLLESLASRAKVALSGH